MSVWEGTNTIALLLMPPGCLLVVSAAGLLLLGRRRAVGFTLIVASWLGLYILSMPYVGDALLQSLESPFSDPKANPAGQAIVVLGGGKYYDAPEYGNVDTVNPQVLARLRYGAQLHRALGKPLLVTGGSPRGEAVAEAETMKRVLEEDYNVPVRWVERASNTTHENAQLSFRLLHPAGVRTIYLVTHAWHMKRSKVSFERAGFTVIPAPTSTLASETAVPPASLTSTRNVPFPEESLTVLVGSAICNVPAAAAGFGAWATVAPASCPACPVDC